MVDINEEVLRRYGVYKTRKLKADEEKELLTIKDEIEKIVNMTVERLYVINESAWGKSPEKAQLSICILVDKRHKDTKEGREKLAYYSEEKNVEIMFWTLCQFEKRKDIPTEEDYYIERYGIKVFDSGKKTEINEKIQNTKYAEIMSTYKYVRSYISLRNVDSIMCSLIRAYTLKIGYPIIGRYEENLQRDADYAMLVSKDKKVIKIIENYLQEEDVNIKKDIFLDFEQYVKKVKQVKVLPKVKEKPTMKVYEKLLKQKEEKGTLDIKTLTKEDLYIMYLIQNIDTFKIADLYGVDDSRITNKRKNWGIKLREKSILDEENIMSEAISKAEELGIKDIYQFLIKQGFLNFQECAFPILEYMLDENVYLLREFWQFTKKEENDVLNWMISKNKKDSYYKASMCVDLLLQNELIEEVDFKQYRITKKGKELVYICYRNNIEKIDLEVICRYFKSAKYYDLYLWRNLHDTFIQNLSVSDGENAKELISEESDNVSTIKKSNELKEDDLESFSNGEAEEPKIKQKEKFIIEEQVANLQLVDKKDLKPKKKSKPKRHSTQHTKVNYLKINEAQIDFGKKCEEIIYKHEIARLIEEGQKNKANSVEWISRDKGDGYGYDIKSFEEIDGKYEEIYIEVKGTDKDITEPFEISYNEVAVSKELKDRYYIYRVGKGNTKNPKFYKIKGSIRENFNLETKIYMASLKNDEI